MLKRTTNHAEPHHKVKVNSARNPIKKPKQSLERKLKSRTSTLKKFFQTQRTSAHPHRMVAREIPCSRVEFIPVYGFHLGCLGVLLGAVV